MKILIADDNDEIRELVRITLESEGHSIRETTNGQEALGELQKEKPDLMILDIDMPELDGYHLVEMLKDNEEWINIPVLMMTGLTEDSHHSDAEWANRLKVNDFISKPFDAKQLIKRVNNILSA